MSDPTYFEKKTNPSFPEDDVFLEAAKGMNLCFQQGVKDCRENFGCPYEWGSMRAGAWMAGYYKELNK